MSLAAGYALMTLVLGFGLVWLGFTMHRGHRPGGWCAGCVGVTTFGALVVVLGGAMAVML